MDPATAIQLAGAALSAAKTGREVVTALVRFYKDANTLDKTMEAFAGEVKALATSCQFVSERLPAIVNDSERNKSAYASPQATGQLWNCLEDQIVACKRTIDDLHQAISTIEVTNVAGITGLTQRVWNQIKLNFHAPDIEEARNRVRSHTASMQTVLICIGIEVNYVGPQRAGQQLQASLVSLTQKTDELKQLIEGSAASPGYANASAILRASNKVISSGKTLCESDAGIDEASTVYGSVAGDLDPLRMASITGWLQHTDFRGSFISEPSSTTEPEGSSVFATSQLDALAFTNNTALSSAPSRSNNVSAIPPVEKASSEFDGSEDDDYRFDIAQHCLRAGRDAFQAHDYNEASAALEEAQKLALELSMSQRDICDTPDIRFMLAICNFHLHSPKLAKSALLKIVENPSVPGPQVCDAGHHLAQTCVKLGELEQARSYCESALRGRRRLLGKTDVATYQSMALLAKILELQGDPSRARFLCGTIPEQHADLIGLFADLTVKSGDDVQSAVASAPLGEAQLQEVPVQAETQPVAVRRLETRPKTFEEMAIPTEEASMVGIPAPHSRTASQTTSLQPVIDQKALQAHPEGTVSSSSAASKKGNQTAKPLSAYFPLGPLEPRQIKPLERRRPEDYFDPDIRAYVEKRGYTSPGPTKTSERAGICTDYNGNMRIYTDVQRALVEGRDEDALRIWQQPLKKSFLRNPSKGDGDLHLAARFGVIEVVEDILKATGDLYINQSYIGHISYLSRPPLDLAAAGGHVKVAAALIKYGASITQGNQCALKSAMFARAYGIFDLLLECGVVSQLVADHGNHKPPLWDACASGNLPLVKALITATPKDQLWPRHTQYLSATLDLHFQSVRILSSKYINDDALSWAAFNGAADVVKYFLECGIPPDTEYIIHSGPNLEERWSTPKSWTSALSLAAAKGHVRVLKLLLTHESTHRFKNDAFLDAASNGKDGAASLLFDEGARTTKSLAGYLQYLPELADKLFQST